MSGKIFNLAQLLDLMHLTCPLASPCLVPFILALPWIGEIPSFSEANQQKLTEIYDFDE